MRKKKAGPSNSVAHEMYKHGEEPRVHVDADEEDTAKAEVGADQS